MGANTLETNLCILRKIEFGGNPCSLGRESRTRNSVEDFFCYMVRSTFPGRARSRSAAAAVAQ